MFLGIDLGTSELKLLLLDDAHGVVAQCGEPLAVQRPRPLWSEQHPHDWWQALDRAMLRLQAAQPAACAAVRAIGLSGQMHGAVLLDEAAAVLRPAILWNDGRSSAECAALEADEPASRRITGNLAMPGFTAPKLRWVRAHEPEVFARVRRVLLPKDWLRLELSGEAASDMSDASGTLWLDVGARRWSPAMLAATGLDEDRMPRLVEGSEPAGALRPQWARRWGLPPGTPIAGGGGDNAASAVGIGAVRPGEGFLSLGTSGVVFLCNDCFSPNPEAAVHAFCHALPRAWHQMSVMLSAASALRWARELLGLRDEAELVARAGQLDATGRARAPLFLPYLAGERSPHNDAHAKGVLFGLAAEHDAAAVGYAVLEGVAFGLADGWQSLAAPPGLVRQLSAVGGGARSADWCQLIANVLEVPLVTHEGGEAGGALGAARLAWLATGAAVADVARAPARRATFEPEPDRQGLLAARHQRYRSLYRALREEFRRP